MRFATIREGDMKLRQRIFATLISGCVLASASTAWAQNQDEVNQITAALDKLADATPANEEELRQYLLRPAVCGVVPRSTKFHCAVAIYELYSEQGVSENYLAVPIFSFAPVGEINQGLEVGETTAVRQAVPASYRNSRHVISLDRNEQKRVSIASLLDERYGVGRDGLRGSENKAHYAFAGVIGRKQNDADKLGLPDELFRTATFRLQ